MTQKPHLARHAGSALAAVLALTATPLLAQDISAAPVPVAPVDVAPVITVPDIAPATPPPVPQAEVPVAAPPPVTAEPAPAPVARTTQARPAQTRAAPTTVAAPAPVAEVAPEPIATAPESLPPIAAAPESILAETAPVAEEPVASPIDNGTIAAIAGGVAALGLLGWGLIAFNRRRTPPRAAVATPIEPETLQSRRAAAIVPTLPEAPVVAETVPVATLDREPLPFTRTAPAPASWSHTVAHGGASVALPREIPKTYEERDALMRRMIAAKPDRANPFKSPIQRYHRAKLIMQSIGRDFGDAKPWIDLSQYPQNWPELQNRYAAAA